MKNPDPAEILLRTAQIDKALKVLEPLLKQGLTLVSLQRGMDALNQIGQAMILIREACGAPDERGV